MIYINARFLTQPLTGVQRYAFEVSMQMKKEDASIVFLTPPNIVHQQWAESLQAKTIGKLTGHLWEQIELPMYLIKDEGAILYSPCNTGPLLFKNQILTLHDIAFKLYPELNSTFFSFFYKILIPKLVNRVVHIFTVSECIKSQIMEHYQVSSSKISVAYNGIGATMALTRKQDIVNLKEKIILCVGSLTKRKNVDIVARVFLNSTLYSDKYKLIFVGSESSIHTLVDIPSDNQIIVLREVNDENLIDLYKKSEIAVCFSSYEGFGIPILEALYFDCKVICSDIPVFKELYSNYVTFVDIQNEANCIKAFNESNTPTTMKNEQGIELFTKFNYQLSAKAILQRFQSL